MKRLKLNCSKMKQDETSHIFDELMEFLRNLLIGVAVGGYKFSFDFSVVDLWVSKIGVSYGLYVRTA